MGCEGLLLTLLKAVRFSLLSGRTIEDGGGAGQFPIGRRQSIDEGYLTTLTVMYSYVSVYAE